MAVHINGVSPVSSWALDYFQKVLNKVEVGHEVRVACHVQGRCAVARYSVDVGAVFNKLFCRMSWFTWFKNVARSCQNGQAVERRGVTLAFFS
jgi:hypothetical protein